MTFNKLVSLMIAIISYPLMYYLATFYTGGDQLLYDNFYEEIKPLGFIDAYRRMPLVLGAAEPVYAIVTWLGSAYFGKLMFFTAINSFFVYFYSCWILKSKPYRYFLPLFLTNYYFVFMLFGAERFKLSFLFLIMALLLKGSAQKILTTMLSLLSHFSSFIFILIPYVVSIAKEKISSKHSIFVVKKKYLYLSIVFMFFFIVVLFLFKNPILGKLSLYSTQIYFSEAVKLLVLILISFYSVEKGKLTQVVTILFIYLLLSLFIGGGRFFLMGFFTLTYFTLDSKKISLLYSILLIYLSFKSYGFISNMVEYGNPFYFTLLVEG